MRCPHCSTDNDPGASVCAACDTPLTAYSGQLTGAEVNPATLARLARLSVRPLAIPAMAALDLLVALLGPVRTVLTNAAARTQTNAEGTNYAQAAFGTVGVAMVAMFLAPLALALVYLAWSTWNRASWAWWANAALLGALGLSALTGFFVGGMFVRALLLAMAAAGAVLWFRQDAREWYGV